MLERVAKFLKGGVFPVSRVLSGIGVGVLVALVLLIIAEIFARRVLNSPIMGTIDLTEVALLLLVFLTLAHCAALGGHVEMDILVSRFPKRVQAGISTIMHILATGIVGVMSWQLSVQAMIFYNTGQTSGTIQMKTYPFVYVAALGSILLTLVYLTRFLYSLDEVRK